MQEGAVEGHGLAALQFRVLIEGVVGLGVIGAGELLLNLVELADVPLVEREMLVKLGVREALHGAPLEVVIVLGGVGHVISLVIARGR